MTRPVRRTVAVVPLRDGTSGKSRLADVLAGPDRTRLVVALARHVVTTLLAADGVDRVVVVTADAAFARSALTGLDRRGTGPDVVAQPPGRPGLDAAVEVGRHHALLGGAATRLLVVHADLAALTVEDVTALLGGSDHLTVAPDRAGTGTNALVLDPAGTGFTFRFGPGSGAAHRREAERRGLRLAVVHRPGTATDLDTVDDWDALPTPVRTRVAEQVPAMARVRARARVVPATGSGAVLGQPS